MTIQAGTLQQRWTPWTARPILLDAALVGGAAILEVILELHDASMPWPPTLPAVRIPVIIAVIAFRRRWPLRNHDSPAWTSPCSQPGKSEP